jgi:hypothetical protein
MRHMVKEIDTERVALLSLITAMAMAIAMAFFSYILLRARRMIFILEINAIVSWMIFVIANAVQIEGLSLRIELLTLY